MEKFLKVMLVITVIANGLSIIGIARKLDRCIVIPDGYRVEAYGDEASGGNELALHLRKNDVPGEFRLMEKE